MKILLFLCALLCFQQMHATKHYGPKYSIDCHVAVEKLANFLGKTYHMQLLHQGVGSLVDSKVVAWDFHLMGHQNLTIDQVRPVIVSMLKSFLQLASKDPIFDIYLKKNHADYSWYDPVFTPKRVGIRLAFWDKNFDRYQFPYVSQVIAAEEEIRYYYANPKDQALEDPIKETFEQAFQRDERDERDKRDKRDKRDQR